MKRLLHLQLFSVNNLLMIVATQAKRASGMMTRATFLLNKERKVCYSAVYPRLNLVDIAVGYFDG